MRFIYTMYYNIISRTTLKDSVYCVHTNVNSVTTRAHMKTLHTHTITNVPSSRYTAPTTVDWLESEDERLRTIERTVHLKNFTVPLAKLDAQKKLHDISLANIWALTASTIYCWSWRRTEGWNRLVKSFREELTILRGRIDQPSDEESFRYARSIFLPTMIHKFISAAATWLYYYTCS